jgi:hypothetical protein
MRRGLVAVIAVAVSAAFAPTAGAASLDFTSLHLKNGWTPYHGETRKPKIARDSDGIVHLEGTLQQKTGSKNLAFHLPDKFTPSRKVFVPVDLDVANKGRLVIQPSGDVHIEAEQSYSDAQLFTSLEGVTFPASNKLDFKKLNPINGWGNYGQKTGAPKAAKDGNGIVHLEGAIAGGASSTAFVVGGKLTPPSDTYVPIDLCAAANGRLFFDPGDGAVNIHTEGPFNEATCFTSLEGATYPVNDKLNFKPLTLVNGWGPYGGANTPGVAKDSNGVVHLEGAIDTGGANHLAFTLPSKFRPPKILYVNVDLTNANKGRLEINPDGTVNVFSETSFSFAQGFTSLEGVSYPL